MNRQQLKAAAKEQIRGKIGILFLITLIIAAISAVAGGVLGMVPYLGPVAAAIVVTPAFALSIVRVYLNVVAGGTPEVGDAFTGFDDFWAAFKVQFLVGLFTYLWTLLLIVPGIIKSLSYSMSMYVLAENKGKSARECIKESMEMTKGHKWELFMLDLSFFGWALLVVLTAGIASIWVAPYIQATLANAYNALKAKDAPVDAAVIAE